MGVARPAPCPSDGQLGVMMVSEDQRPASATPLVETERDGDYRAPKPGDRVLVLHSYPPVPCLHTFERGLRELGHDVVCVGPHGDYGSAEVWRDVDPGCSYRTVALDAELDDIFQLIGGRPDWVFYLRPSTGFLPRGLAECPVPTVAWLEDEFKNVDAYHHLSYYFDLVGTAYSEIEDSFRQAGHDNWVCFNYFTASWLTPEEPVRFADREIDISFVGHSVPTLTRLRCLELEKLRRLTGDGVTVCALQGRFMRDMMRLYARSKMGFQHSGQGPPNLTYRVGEAMAAGAMVIAKRPNRVGGLVRPLVEGEHIVYYDEFDEAADAIHYYLDHDAERMRIAEAGHRYVSVEAPWTTQVQAFLDTHVYTIDADFRARRSDRLRRFAVDARRQQIDRAWYFAGCSGQRDQARMELERIRGWEDDPYVRCMYATCGSPNYAADVEAVLRAKPRHLLTIYNYADRVFASRASIGAKGVLAAIQGAIGCFTRVNPRALEADEIEGLMAFSDARLRAYITDAYLEREHGAQLRERLHSLLLAQLYKNRGITLYEDRKYADAQKALSRAAHTLADDGYLSAYLARTASELGRAAEAETLYTDAIRCEPHFAEAHCELASLLRELERPGEAARLLEDALLSYLSLDASRLAMYLGLAEARIALGQRDEARAAIRTGIEELESGTLDTGAYTISRQVGAISAAESKELRRALGGLADRARGRNGA
ncbi:glycosyltransferase [Candidatus Poribacteria bacterium]|nr:glycosyltransferase [Candidatus Poribacteria bacterium]MBT7809003.1 glycosyltransferase [Candidatus Poribacteria bacterium]